MADDFDIKTLPTNFKSKSHPSKIIERLYEKRKLAHHTIVNEMNDRKKDVNADIDEKIKEKSRFFVEKLHRIKNDTEAVLFLENNKEINEDNLEAINFEKIMTKLNESSSVRKKLVDELNKCLAEIEKERAESFKLILKETFDKLSTISHKLPLELEEFFENEIVNINQLTLNNYQKHSELQADLKSQIENDTRMWTQQLYEIKENVKIILKKLAQKSLTKSKCKLKKTLEQRRSDMFDKEMADCLAGELTAYVDPSAPVVLREVEKWITGIRGTLAAMDGTAKNFVHFYKETIVVLFNRYFEEMEEIKTELISTGYLNKDDIEEFQREIYTPSADEFKFECQAEFEHLQNVWNNIISSMQTILDDTFKCLKAATGLWESHFRRIEELKSLVLRNVEATAIKNSTASEKHEVKLDIVIDKLRQCPTQQKLEKTLVDTKKLLDFIVKTCVNNGTIEMNLIKKYRIMMSSEIDVLMSEIQRFLTVYPPDEDRDPKKQRRRASQISEIQISSVDHLIPPHMLFCQFQVDAVKNWTFGLWEALNQYLSFGREEILFVADCWIESECSRVREHLDVKLSFHRPRYERIKQILYQKRLGELNEHNSRFDRHKMAVEEEVKALKEKQKSCEDKYNEICKNHADLAEKYESKVMNSRSEHELHGYKERLNGLTKVAVESAEKVLNENTSACEEIRQNLRIANFKFFKAVKSFSEGGNYAADEIKVLLKNLAKLEKTTGKSLQAIEKDARSKFNKYSGKLENENSDMTSMIEEATEEFKHNGRCVKKIKVLQDDVRFEVLSFKADLKLLEASFKQLIEDSGDKLGDPAYLEDFSDKAEEVATRMFHMSTSLPHPQPITMYTLLTTKSDLSMKTFTDYTSLLFSSKPKIDEDTFLSKMLALLRTSLQDIQANAKEFYAIHNCLLLDSSKIQPTYDDFMNEVLTKYKGYLVQIEVCWAENVSHFLNILSAFIEFKEDYLSRFETELQRVGHERCRAATEYVMKQLREEKKKMKRRYMGVHQQLKAMHGHPNNRLLLENIEDDFHDLVSETEKKLDQILGVHTAIITEEYKNVEATFVDTEKVLEVLRQDYGLKDLRSFVSRQLKQKLERMNEMIADEEPPHSTPTDSDVPPSINKQVISYMKNADIQQQIVKNLLFVTNPSSGASEKSVNFGRELEENCEEDVRKISDFISSEIVEYHDSFQKIWTNEINAILGLYLVKYDQRNMPME